MEIATEDAPLRPHEADIVVERSGGNPMFLMELLDAVRASGSVESLPDSVEALIAGQIDRLAPTDRMILRYAAVLGTRFDPALLEEAVRSDVELDSAVWDRLSDVLSLDVDGSLRFENNLVRDAAYEGLPYRRRRVLHERVGETIEATAGESTEEEVATLALHFHEAQRWDKSWTYCRQAGDRAMRVYANADASRFFARALVAGRRLRSVPARDLAGVQEKHADALYLLGEYEQADDALRAGRRLLGMDPIESAPLAIKQAIMTNRTGKYRQTRLRVGRALRALEGRRGRAAAASRARLMLINAATTFFQNRRSESISWSRRAEREARRAGAKDALAEAYKLLDNAYKENGEIEKAVYSDRALRLYEELGDLRSQALILNNQGVFAQELSDWDKASELYRRALDIFDTVGDTANASLAKYNIAEILSDQGRYDEVEPLLREVLRVWRGQGAEADVAAARRELGKLFARRGEFETAGEMLRLAIEEQERTGQVGELLATTMRICELEVLRGEGAAAVQHIDAALRTAAHTEGGSVLEPILTRLRGWALAQGGRTDEARTELEAALRAAEDRGDRYECLLVADALITIGGSRIDQAQLLHDRRLNMEKLGVIVTPSFPLVSSAALVS